VYVEAHRRERGQCTHKEAPHNGGLYSPPPSKKHGSVEVSGTQTMLSPNFEKKVRKSPPPKDGPAGGFPHLFFENRRQHGLGR